MSDTHDIDDFKTGHNYNEQYDYQELEDDERDAAWEEYLSTGIDPTGGELGPDFVPETGEGLPEEEYVVTSGSNSTGSGPSKPFGWDRLLLFGIVAFFIIGIISWIDKSQKEKARVEQAARDKEYAEYQQELQRQRERERLLNEHVKTAEEIEAEKQATREDVQRLLNSGRGLYGQGATPSTAGKPAQVQSNLPKGGTPFGDGYWDGYEEGYDDADGHNQYGFKYDESTNKYSGKALSEYVRGYRKGYKAGWDEGQEVLEDRFDMGDPEIDEGDW